ncbi:MAG TPA: PadR family transcriptional regulator [Methanocella sp.]|nr:PadR family transcriptional regulator [Methanocella sp.]
MSSGDSRKQCDAWLNSFTEACIYLAVLAVIRREETTVQGAVRNLSIFTAGMVSVDEPRMAAELDMLIKQGLVERHGSLYQITAEGKLYMFDRLVEWNRYVDSLNNLWGCFHGS